MSSLHKSDPLPALRTRAVASSKREYWKENSSLEISSFIEEPTGCDRSIMRRMVPSFFGAAPMGEQCVSGNGGCVKGPAVWPREISFLIA